MVYCSVPSCNSKGNKGFYRFPLDPVIRAKWLERVRNPILKHLSEKGLRAKRICKKHFRDICMAEHSARNVLKQNALPTYYLPVFVESTYANCFHDWDTALEDESNWEEDMVVEADVVFVGSEDAFPVAGPSQLQSLPERQSPTAPIIQSAQTEPSATPSRKRPLPPIICQTPIRTHNGCGTTVKSPTVINITEKQKKSRINISTDNYELIHLQTESVNKNDVPPNLERMSIVDSIPNTPIRIKLTESNFENICFICYRMKSQLTELYDMEHSYFKDDTLRSVLQQICDKVSNNTKAPQHLCLSCIKIMLQLFKFLKQIKTAQNMYEKILILGNDFRVANECNYPGDLSDASELLQHCELKTKNDLVNNPLNDINPNISYIDITTDSHPNSPDINNDNTDDFANIIDDEFFIAARKNVEQDQHVDNQTSTSKEKSTEPGKVLDSISSASILHSILTPNNESNLIPTDAPNIADVQEKDKIENSIKYKIILQMPFHNRTNPAKDCDFFYDIDFDDDIDAMTDFNLGEFRLGRNRTLPIYRCSTCGETFKSSSAAQTHRTEMKHRKKYSRKPGKISRCETCDSTFPNAIRLWKHRLTHMFVDCKVCGVRLKKKSLRLHLKTHLPNWHELRAQQKTRVLCTQCGKTFSRRMVQFHVPCGTVQRRTMTCKECPFTTKFNTSMARHKMMHEKNYRFKCEHCSFATIQKMCLDVHMKVHTELPNRRVYDCRYCEQQFNTKYNFKEHTKLYHKEEKIKRPSRIPSFRRVRGNRKKPSKRVYTCKICNKGFNKQYTFLLHAEITHGYPIALLRSQNTTTFSVESNTNEPQHVNQASTSAEPTHWNAQVMVQDATNIQMVSKEALSIPSLFYTTQDDNEENSSDVSQEFYVSQLGYHCRHCSVVSRNIASFRVHLDLHFNRKRFQCNICTSRFRQESNLTQHILHMHSELRPNVCNYCDRAYKTPASLQDHIRTHTGEWISCEYCALEFQYSSSYYKHLRQQHDIHKGDKRKHTTEGEDS